MVSAAAVVGAAVVGGLASKSAARTAAGSASEGRQVSAQQAAIGRGDIGSALPRTLGELSLGAGQAIGQLQPVADIGGGAFDIQAALSGALGPEAQQQAIQGFQASPEQAFLKQEAEQASLRNASATGGVGGGRIRQELQRQAIGFGSQDIQNRFNRLGAIAGQGLDARTNIANLQSSLGSARAQAQQSAGQGLANIAIGQGAQQSNLALAQGQARAAGTLGVSSAFQQGLGQLSQQGFFSPQQQQQTASQGFFGGTAGR